VTAVARIWSRWPLRYSEGPDPAHDRPGHVRAGSGLAHWRGGLAVAQDDASWLAWLDVATGRVDAIALPADRGVRLFGDDRGNKARKGDHESAFALPDGRLVLAGSGSTAARRGWWVVDGASVRRFDAGALYDRLAALAGFASAEFNVEGATVHDGALWLAGRSNGAARGGGPRRDGLARVDLGAATAWLDGRGAAPDPESANTVDLGTVAGVRLTITDLASDGGALWFAAAAEDSPDAIGDGRVTGSAIGALGGPIWRVCDGDLPTTDKVEGLAADPDRPGWWWAVVDADDTGRPADLLHLSVVNSTS